MLGVANGVAALMFACLRRCIGWQSCRSGWGVYRVATGPYRGQARTERTDEGADRCGRRGVGDQTRVWTPTARPGRRGCRPWQLGCRGRSGSARLRAAARLRPCWPGPTRKRDHVPSITMPSLKHAIARYQSSRDVSRPPAAAVRVEQFAASRKAAECGQLRACGDRVGFQRPADQHPAEIQQRVADGAHLPVDERRQFGLVAAQQNIAQMRVAVHDSRLPVWRTVGLQPLRQVRHRQRFGRIVVRADSFRAAAETAEPGAPERNPAA